MVLWNGGIRMRGKVIFFGLSGGMGPVLRCLPIADQFRLGGADVRFSIYDSFSKEVIMNQGYTYIEDDDPTTPSPDLVVQSNRIFYNLDHYFAQAGLLDYTFAQAWIYSRIRMLKRIKASLVVTDMSPHTVIAAQFLGIPIVSITQSCFHPDGERVYAWGEPPRNLPKVTPVINKILQELKLPVIDKMERLNSGDIDLIPSIPELDPVSSDTAAYIGPLGSESITNDTVDLEVSSNKPIILVNPGRLYDSAGNSGERLVQRVLEAFRNRDVEVLIAVQGKLPWKWNRSKSKSIRFIPEYSRKLLERCNLFIHHGGHGSCLSAIIKGIPSLVIPTHTEREYNARKICKLGVAEYMLPDTFTPEHLYQMSRYIISDDYTKRAGEWCTKIKSRNYGGAQLAFTQSVRLLNE
jgi:UDP:flavonoid glycosyltransferase YjiC (YdhE family)